MRFYRPVKPGWLLVVVIALLLGASSACVLSEAPTSSGLAATLAVLETESARQATRIARQEALISHLATRVGTCPTPTTGPPPTMTPYVPVFGSVEIEGGQCCVGGTMGDTIRVQVSFDASSQAAEVAEMRVRVGAVPFGEAEMSESTWEPFADQKTYPVDVAVGWTGFYVSVQYRDTQGNLSPVYHDDISVEGNPPSSPSPETTP